MVKVRRLLRSIGFATATTLIVLALIFLTLALKHEKLLSVQTASMVPTFKPGDAIIVRSLKASNGLPDGSVITFRSPDNPRVLVTHRLIGQHGHELITAGDALGTHDKQINRDQVVGTATAVLPGLGRWLDRLHRPIWLLIMVYMPATALGIYELNRLLGKFRPPLYRAFGYR